MNWRIEKKFTSKKIYVSNLNDSALVFLQILSLGKANIYFLKDKDSKDHYFIEQNNKIIEIIGKTIINVNGGIFTTQGNYKQILKTNFDTCKNIEKQIDKLSFEKGALIHITNEYNKCLNDYKYHYIPQRDMLYFGIKAGYYPVQLRTTSFGSYSFSTVENKYASEIGIFLVHQQPAIDKKLFAEVGMSVINLDMINRPAPHFDLNFPDFSVKILQVPISLKYNIINRNFSPYLLLGGFININLSHKINSKPFSYIFENNINSKSSGYHFGGGIRYSLKNSEYKVEYKRYFYDLNGNGSDSNYRIVSNSICLTFALIRK